MFVFLMSFDLSELQLVSLFGCWSEGPLDCKLKLEKAENKQKEPQFLEAANLQTNVFDAKRLSQELSLALVAAHTTRINGSPRPVSPQGH